MKAKNLTMHKEPACSIVKLLGGPKVVSAIVGKHPSRVYRWMYPSETREGGDGVIPARDARKLLDYAHKAGIDLRPEDFFSGDRLKAAANAERAA